MCCLMADILSWVLITAISRYVPIAFASGRMMEMFGMISTLNGYMVKAYRMA